MQTKYQYYDEFSVYTTTDDVVDFINQLLESGLECDYEIFEKCTEYFGKYLSIDIYNL
jgi:hypothetical protein